MEGNTPPPRPQPGEGYAATCPALGVAPARRAVNLIGALLRIKRNRLLPPELVGQAQGLLCLSVSDLFLGLREPRLARAPALRGFRPEVTRTRRCAENTEDGRGARTHSTSHTSLSVMGGRLVMPAELQRVHRAVLDGVEITEEMRAVVERRWPELVARLPPRQTA